MGSSCPQVHLLDIASPHRVPPDRGLCVCVCVCVCARGGGGGGGGGTSHPRTTYHGNLC